MNNMEGKILENKIKQMQLVITILVEMVREEKHNVKILELKLNSFNKDVEDEEYSQIRKSVLERINGDSDIEIISKKCNYNEETKEQNQIDNDNKEIKQDYIIDTKTEIFNKDTDDQHTLEGNRQFNFIPLINTTDSSDNVGNISCHIMENITSEDSYYRDKLIKEPFKEIYDKNHKDDSHKNMNEDLNDEGSKGLVQEYIINEDEAARNEESSGLDYSIKDEYTIDTKTEFYNEVKGVLDQLSQNKGNQIDFNHMDNTSDISDKIKDITNFGVVKIVKVYHVDDKTEDWSEDISDEETKELVKEYDTDEDNLRNSDTNIRKEECNRVTYDINHETSLLIELHNGETFEHKKSVKHNNEKCDNPIDYDISNGTALANIDKGNKKNNKLNFFNNNDVSQNSLKTLKYDKFEKNISNERERTEKQYSNKLNMNVCLKALKYDEFEKNITNEKERTEKQYSSNLNMNDFTFYNQSATESFIKEVKEDRKRSANLDSDQGRSSKQRKLYRLNGDCNNCSACKADDCDTCRACLDKPRNGGPNTYRRRCFKRICSNKLNILDVSRSYLDKARNGSLNVFRKMGCNICPGCKAMDCDKCRACLDKPRNGGPNKFKRRCFNRTCYNK